ncbi:MAG: uroporphyrinogen decarboxylase family protein [Chloroflexota bacterium]
MNSLERVRTVLDGGIADRVPVCLENFMHACAVAGVSLQDYCVDGDLMAATHLAAWRRFGHDLIDLENGVTALAGAAGCTVEIPDDQNAPWVIAPAIAGIEEVGSLRPIDPERDGTLPAMVRATRRLAEELGGEVAILAEADQGPFSLAAQIVGIEDFLVALMDPRKADLVEQLLTYTTEQVITYALALHAAGAHLTMMGESVAGPDVCSPAVYREFALPWERRVVEAVAAKGGTIGIHVCGNATRIIDDLVSTGARFLQVDYKIDRERCKSAAAGRTTLIGTVDPSGVLALGTPEAVRAAAETDLRTLAEGGGFILSPGCSLPYPTPDANVDALLAAARAWPVEPGIARA